jgi:transcriptional regulator with XRE-family HTH domain
MQAQPVGELLRVWRQRRRMSQLDLAYGAEISPKHVSFLETGRALPSREMLLRLAEQLDIPLRERNTLLVAAGFAPVFSERPLDDPALQAARDAVGVLLAAHEPYPALAIDRHWTLVAFNRVVPLLLDGVDPALLAPPANVLRISMHPGGLAPRIVNYGEWRGHLFARLRHQIELSADPVLAELLRELSAYPLPPNARAYAPVSEHAHADIVIPLRLASASGTLSFIGTTTVFGTPLDITVSELALETFFPADHATAEALRHLVG